MHYCITARAYAAPPPRTCAVLASLARIAHNSIGRCSTPFLAVHVLFSTMSEVVPLKNQGWSQAGWYMNSFFFFFMYHRVCKTIPTYIHVLKHIIPGNQILYIGRPDTATLCSELVSVSDWRTLGLYLGVQDYELDQIERSHPTEGCGRWKQETFSLWLQRKSSASWGDVVGALRRMGQNTEAERLELKFIVPVPASKLYGMMPH